MKFKKSIIATGLIAGLLAVAGGAFAAQPGSYKVTSVTADPGTDPSGMKLSDASASYDGTTLTISAPGQSITITPTSCTATGATCTATLTSPSDTQLSTHVTFDGEFGGTINLTKQ